MGEFLDDKFDVGQEDEGTDHLRQSMPVANNYRTGIKRMELDLDIQTENRLSKALLKDVNEKEPLLLFEDDQYQGGKKAHKESKMKRFKQEIRGLKQQNQKLKDMLFTDKNLKQMKSEYNELLTECKQIVQHLETKVQHTMLAEDLGPESTSLMELLDQTLLSPGHGKGKKLKLMENQDHIDLGKLNSMTMNHFELNFVQEIHERVTTVDLLTVQDIKKIRSMLKFIYRQVMRLTSEKEPKE